MRNIIFFLMISVVVITSAQTTNEFKIGMFGFQWKTINNLPATVPVINGFNTSSLNVFAEDGFNVVQLYAPDEWFRRSDLYDMENILKLVDANNMKIVVNAMRWYWPGHINIYNNATGARANYWRYIEELYNKTEYKKVVYAHQITEEAAYFHESNASNDMPPYSLQYVYPSYNNQTKYENGTYLAQSNSWNVINFSTPYWWDGVQNLVIEVSFDNNTSSTNSTIKYSNTVNNTVWSRFSNVQSNDIASSADMYVGAGYTKRPNMKIYGNVTAQIGNEQNISDPIETGPTPFGTLYQDGKTQFIITAAELRAQGLNNTCNINAIAFYVVNASSQVMNHFKVRVGITDVYRPCDKFVDGFMGFCNTEVPPVNVNQALTDFRNKLNLANVPEQKLILMDAAHGRVINDAFSSTMGIYEPQNYLNLSNMPDIFFEGSYLDMSNPPVGLSDYSCISRGEYHYLGFLKSLDYAQQRVPVVHKVVCSYSHDKKNNVLYDHVYHYNSYIKNANWLWFTAYASVIHGAKGIWFWGDPWDDRIDGTVIPSGEDRFARGYFPQQYRDFVSNLSRELRYLVDENMLSTDPNSVVCSKTDGIDYYGVLPSNKSYLQGYSGEYDLRYTIRSNGSEAIMIIANPLPFSISNVNICLSNIPNAKIKNAVDGAVLFEYQADVNSNTYKTDRNSNINLPMHNMGKSHLKPISTCNNTFQLNFGPLDVHVIRIKYKQPVGWNEIATAGHLASTSSDLAVEVNGNNRRIFYIRNDGYIGNTYNMTNTWQNSWFSSFPQANVSSGLQWNDANKELFYIPSGSSTISRIYWNGSEWQFQATAGTSANASSDLAFGDGFVFYIGQDKYIRSTFKINNVWSNAWFSNCPKANLNSGLSYNAALDELFYVAENNSVCRMYYSGSSWVYEYTNGINARSNSDIVCGGGFVFYIGSDGIIRMTYKNNGVWQNSWFPSAPAAASYSGLKWESSTNTLYYISSENKVVSIYWNNGWNSSVISGNCDELATRKIDIYGNHICYVGQDGIVHEYTKDPNTTKSEIADNQNINEAEPRNNLLEEYLQIAIATNSDFILNEKVNDEISIYPNPASDFVFISGIKDPVDVEIYNSLGILVDRKYDVTEKIDLFGINSDLVYIKIIDDDLIKVIKVRMIK